MSIFQTISSILLNIINRSKTKNNKINPTSSEAENGAKKNEFELIREKMEKLDAENKKLTQENTKLEKKIKEQEISLKELQSKYNPEDTKTKDAQKKINEIYRKILDVQDLIWDDKSTMEENASKIAKNLVSINNLTKQTQELYANQAKRFAMRNNQISKIINRGSNQDYKKEPNVEIELKELLENDNRQNKSKLNIEEKKPNTKNELEINKPEITRL